jgi:2-iminobutanoate/2-iminopropanoate deaminase
LRHDGPSLDGKRFARIIKYLDFNVKNRRLFMAKQAVSTPHAPRAVGPYSQGILANGFIFVSGQVPLGPDGKLIVGDIQAMARQCLENIRAILAAAGATMEDLVKVTVFARDLNQFKAINEVYQSYFSKTPPARSFVEVSRLPRDAEIEMEGIAVLPQ